MRRFLLRKRVLIPLGSGLCLMLVGYFVLLPWVVRGRVDAVLRQVRLRDVSYRVTRATPWTSTIRDVEFGGGTRIAELRVTYSVEGLWNRRVDNIRIRGLQLAAEVRDGAASLGPLDALLRPARAATRPASQPAPVRAHVASTAGDWPFRSVRAEESVLVVRLPDRTLTMPFEGTLKWPQLRLAAEPRPGQTLTIEGSVGDEESSVVRFNADGVAGDDVTALLRGFAPHLPAMTSAAVRASGTVSRAGDKTTLDLKLALVPAAEAIKPAAQPAGTNVVVEEGVFQVAASVGDGATKLHVVAAGVALAETSLGANASGISTDVTFDSLSPASTGREQVLRVAKLSASKLHLTDGFTRFELAPDGTLHVKETHWTFLGGEVSANDVRVAAGQPVVLTLTVKDLQLRDLLALLARGKATGEGKVNGELPLVIADGQVTPGEGFAQAEAGGTLSVTDVSALEPAIANPRDPAQASQAQVRGNIVEALKDFQYESLTARLVNDPQRGLVAYVRMTGKGRTGARQALDYDLRVTGLNDLLRSLVGVHQTVTREAARP